MFSKYNMYTIIYFIYLLPSTLYTYTYSNYSNYIKLLRLYHIGLKIIKNILIIIFTFVFSFLFFYSLSYIIEWYVFFLFYFNQVCIIYWGPVFLQISYLILDFYDLFLTDFVKKYKSYTYIFYFGIMVSLNLKRRYRKKNSELIHRARILSHYVHWYVYTFWFSVFLFCVFHDILIFLFVEVIYSLKENGVILFLDLLDRLAIWIYYFCVAKMWILKFYLWIFWKMCQPYVNIVTTIILICCGICIYLEDEIMHEIFWFLACLIKLFFIIIFLIIIFYIIRVIYTILYLIYLNLYQFMFALALYDEVKISTKPSSGREWMFIGMMDFEFYHFPGGPGKWREEFGGEDE